jgi:hypothetical protein
MNDERIYILNERNAPGEAFDDTSSADLLKEAMEAIKSLVEELKEANEELERKF